MRIRLVWPYLSAVKLSVKSDYAARAVLGLARHYHNGATRRIDALAEEQGVPPNYLVQILIELKARGIVRSIRGKEGGYKLARSPAEVSLGDVLRCVYGQIFDAPALTDEKCAHELREAWRKLQSNLDKTADSITFQQILDAGSDKGKMYYI